MEWLDTLYSAAAGGGIYKIADLCVRAYKDSKRDLLHAEEDFREELRKECDTLRERVTYLEQARRDCNHKLANRDQQIVALRYELDKHEKGGS